METQVTYQIREKVAELDARIKGSLPGLPVLLQEIHKQLQKDPELITILSDEELGVIVAGLEKQTKTEIVSSSVAITAAKKKLKAGVSMDDI